RDVAVRAYRARRYLPHLHVHALVERLVHLDEPAAARRSATRIRTRSAAIAARARSAARTPAALLLGPQRHRAPPRPERQIVSSIIIRHRERGRALKPPPACLWRGERCGRPCGPAPGSG